jgi:DNA-binding HxlR family transcriptional regulator
VLGRTYDNQVCSCARALGVIGERWSLLIIRDALFLGATRFSQFRRSLGIARNILSSRLDFFVVEGLMERRPTAVSGYYEYVLTEKGRELEPVVIALTQWGDRWLAPDGPPFVYAHDCGGDVETVTVCRTCSDEVDIGSVRLQIGPGQPAPAR